METHSLASMLARYSEMKPKTYSSIQTIQDTNSYVLESTNEQPQEDLLALPGSDTQQQPQKRLFAPNVRLTGHGAEVYCVKFSPDGNQLASAGFDKLIFLWDVYRECKNTATLKGHKNAITEINYSTDGTKLYSSSADKTVGVWDLEAMKKIKKFTGHTSFVNSCSPARRGLDIVVSGSDDATAKVWDLRMKEAVHSLDCKYQVTATLFNDTAEKVITAGIDNQIKIWDLRTKKVENYLGGHMDTITGLALSSDGSYLLSNSMDMTVRCWDIRPFVTTPSRCVKIFQGSTHNYEKNLLRVGWSEDGLQITAGSADGYLLTLFSCANEANVGMCMCGTRLQGKSLISSADTVAR